MRTIKYRGKVEGVWWYVTPEDFNWEQFWAIADKDTVDEYTGIKDAKGSDVYEGDIVCYDAIDTIGVVTWISNGPGFLIFNPEKTTAFVLHGKWEVIGNVYDNPELAAQVGEQV